MIRLGALAVTLIVLAMAAVFRRGPPVRVIVGVIREAARHASGMTRNPELRH